MGASQVGGLASLLEVDYNNAAGFLGNESGVTEAQYIVYFLSHTMIFCVGTLIESHVVLTPTYCTIGEMYKFEVYAGTHAFRRNIGASRICDHICFYNTQAFRDTQDNTFGNLSMSRRTCDDMGISLMILNGPYNTIKQDKGAQYVIKRVRYGKYITPEDLERMDHPVQCEIHGWGSRRNGFLLPMLIKLQKMNLDIVSCKNFDDLLNYRNQSLCIEQPVCSGEKFGALCPDDLGTILVCNGFIQGIMVSQIVDRPCGVGYLDLSAYMKFLTCAVDDSRDVIGKQLPTELSSEMLVSVQGPRATKSNDESGSVEMITETTTECDDCVE